jgi:hypothetical protein
MNATAKYSARIAQLARIFDGNATLADFHVICSPRHHYMYLGTPKTASSTVRKILIWLEVDGDMAQVPKQIWDWTLIPFSSISELDVKVDEVFFTKKYFRFAFVRNPYTRILSCYLDKIVGPFHQRQVRLPKLGLKPDAVISFSKFVDRVKEMPLSDDHWAPQVELLRPSRIDYDVIGRFESFQSSMQTILGHIQPDAAVPWQQLVVDRHATGAASRVAELIGVHERRIIEKVYEADFEQFGYSHDPHLAGC